MKNMVYNADRTIGMNVLCCTMKLLCRLWSFSNIIKYQSHVNAQWPIRCSQMCCLKPAAQTVIFSRPLGVTLLDTICLKNDHLHLASLLNLVFSGTLPKKVEDPNGRKSKGGSLLADT